MSQMAIGFVRPPIARLTVAAALLLGSLGLSGCLATQGYVDDKIAEVNTHISQVDAKATEAGQKADAANAAAQSAQAAANQANQRLDQLTPRVDTLEQRMAAAAAQAKTPHN
jgi:outer membrane murein-binding lipoprotein Lpp